MLLVAQHTYCEYVRVSACEKASQVLQHFNHMGKATRGHNISHFLKNCVFRTFREISITIKR